MFEKLKEKTHQSIEHLKASTIENIKEPFHDRDIRGNRFVFDANPTMAAEEYRANRKAELEGKIAVRQAGYKQRRMINEAARREFQKAVKEAKAEARRKQILENVKSRERQRVGTYKHMPSATEIYNREYQATVFNTRKANLEKSARQNAQNFVNQPPRRVNPAIFNPQYGRRPTSTGTIRVEVKPTNVMNGVTVRRRRRNGIYSLEEFNLFTRGRR